MDKQFNYANESSRDILCIDVKSFFASVECVARGYHPLKKMLVVMSKAENAGGLVLAASPQAKKELGISNVTRKYELPFHPDLEIVPPRMALYIEKNKEINQIYRQYVAEEDIYPYSIDESFLDATASHSLFHASTQEIAQKIQRHVWHQTGLYITVGIGENPLLAKLALDNAAKNAPNFRAEWRYSDVPKTVWQINPLTAMWGIGQRTEKRLAKLKIGSVYQLAQTDAQKLKKELGVIGAQLHANAWGIDRSRISERYTPTEKSYGNSQILNYDYHNQAEIELVIREMAEQVATRLRAHHCQTQCVHLYVGYSRKEMLKGFAHQNKIPATSNSKKLVEHCLHIFRKYYQSAAVRQIGVSYSKILYTANLQLDLFSNPEEQIAQENLDLLIDRVRDRYGFTSIVHASSILHGGTAIKRSKLLGGHQAE